MKIMSWNIAGFKSMLKKNFSKFMEETKADIYCLQETKITKEDYSFYKDDYYSYLFPAQRKGYSGVLILTKIKPINVIYGINIEEIDSEGRILTLEFADFYLVNIYSINTKPDLSRLKERIKCERKLYKFLNNLKEKKKTIVCGDFNVAYEDIDIHPEKKKRQISGITNEERESFSKLLSSGFTDCLRYKYGKIENQFTNWCYSKNVRERNIGWRVDYFLVSKELETKIVDINLLTNVYGSDHCPLLLTLNRKDDIK